MSTRSPLPKKCLKALHRKPLKRLPTALIISILLFSCVSPEPHYECVSNGNPFGIVDTIVAIAAVGDMMFARGVAAHMDTTGFGAPFYYVASYLNLFDITTGNLECPVSHLGEPLDKKYAFRADPKIIPELAKSGFDVVCVANNHAFDYGLPCFLNTIERLRDAGIEPIGGGRDLNEALKPVYIYRNGLCIGFLAFNDTRTNYIGRDRPACAPAYDKWVFSAIHIARDSCNILIVHVHWGEEYFAYPTDRQMALGHAMIDSGATVVLGHHPHRWQGIEFYGDGVIAYSLGNFIFDQKDLLNNLSGILEIVFNRGKIVRVEITPVELITHPKEPHFAKGEFTGIFSGLIREVCAIFPTEIDTSGAGIILKPVE